MPFGLSHCYKATREAFIGFDWNILDQKEEFIICGLVQVFDNISKEHHTYRTDSGQIKLVKEVDTYSGSTKS